MCKKNVGRLDAYLRISTGVILTGVGIMRKKGCLTVLGGMKIAEGITRYCPVLDIIGYSTISEEEYIEEILGLDSAVEPECNHHHKGHHHGEEHSCHCGGHEHHDAKEHHCCSHDNVQENLGTVERRQYIHRGIKRNQYLNRWY